MTIGPRFAFRLPLSAFLPAILGVLTVFATPAQAQTFTVLYTFTGGTDGGNPAAGLTMDGAGNLYGTAESYGTGYGTVYKLKRSGSSWIFNLLHSFTRGTDGNNPEGRVIFGPDGALYGTTFYGGGDGALGTVFELRPAPTACAAALCPWSETLLHSFRGHDDGTEPVGDLTFDQAGNVYGTTTAAGIYDGGVVYELTPSGGGWAESILYSFGSGSNGSAPSAGLTFDQAGNLYGTTAQGGTGGYGTAFKLAYSGGSGWTESLLYSFDDGSDGGYVNTGLIFDQSGNLYGATNNAGANGGGTVFKLTPSGGSWTFSLLYSFTSENFECGPFATLVMDGAGNLYGTTRCDGAYGYGSVFKLTPSSNGWTYTSLHDFTDGDDGADPVSNVIFDADGNLYGTAYAGGSQRYYGTVWEITP